MSAPNSTLRQLYLPEILLAASGVQPGVGLLVNGDGMVEAFCKRDDAPSGTQIIPLLGKALLPGLANSHSHTFQRLFRGRAEGRAAGGDTFWTWREQMYRAAAFVSPEDLYDVARVTFLEMALAGITLVGEFHYLHRDGKGQAYADPNLLSRQVIAAAESVGIRICLLRSAYFRAGFGRDPHPGQKRFYETVDDYLRNLTDLVTSGGQAANLTIAAAPHSIRAVPLEQVQTIAEFARSRGSMPLHIHISEQVAENQACVAEYGATPVELLREHGVLSPNTTLIHAIHLSKAEFVAVSHAGATICSCPTTERNLGDGIFQAEIAAELGIHVAFGTDSQAQIDILEDARELEYHLRLRDQQRGILDGSSRPDWRDQESIGQHLFRSASSNGYRALGLNAGKLAIGQPADFFTVDLSDLSVLGVSADGADSETVTSQAIFALSKSAICDVAVQGKLIVENGQHRDAEQIKLRYRDVQERFLQQATLSR